MEVCGRCPKIRIVVRAADPRFVLRRSTQLVEGLGDIVAMLKLPSTSRLYPKETATIKPVSQENGAPWVPDQRADILVLGDSFFNIFSLAEMGWGASAGFVEQLSYTLGRPLDAILRNDAGAFATREARQELARGRDRPMGKRLVIWEFAASWATGTSARNRRVRQGFLALESANAISSGNYQELGPCATWQHAHKDFLTAFHIVGGGDPAKEQLFIS
jgi:hypothetical protein